MIIDDKRLCLCLNSNTWETGEWMVSYLCYFHRSRNRWNKSIETTTEVTDDDTALSRSPESDQTSKIVAVTIQPYHSTNIDFRKRFHAVENWHRSFNHSNIASFDWRDWDDTNGRMFCHPCRMVTSLGLLRFSHNAETT